MTGITESPDPDRVPGLVVVLLLSLGGPACLRGLAPDTLAEGTPWSPRWTDTATCPSTTWYRHPRSTATPIVNDEQAWALTARLGYPDLVDLIGPDGDLIIAGTRDDGRPDHVPRTVIDAARRTGLLETRGLHPSLSGSLSPERTAAPSFRAT